ncbi:hypothetical protein FQA39_LY13692 [Lamprigera yunnana]|nr:hypothetical protein FQA39_LY13692 [Lamprigera yunnana]
MATEDKELLTYYRDLKASELARSDVSIYPSYSNLGVLYFVASRQRYTLAGIKHRRQFINEVKIHENLQYRALDGVRVHREFCNPILKPIDPSEVIKFTIKEERRLNEILDARY